jgi:membrane associated rhomboid family serine protease
MQTQRSFIDELKSQYATGGAFIKLIFINAAIFLIINILMVFSELSNIDGSVSYYLGKIFALPRALDQFITQPWTLFTSIFAHYGFLHLLMNMVFLYFAGRYFEQIFNSKRLVYTYIFGGLMGGLLEILAYMIFPALQENPLPVVGASGSIMAIFIAIAFHQPNLQIRLFTLPPFRIIWVALVYIGIDLLNLSNAESNTAHFAHLGGAIFGMISVQNFGSSSNIVTLLMNTGDSVVKLFKRKKSPKLKVKKGGNVRMMTDEEYNADAKTRQDETNRILDKISKSGYESLSKKEKDFLFNQSKK